VTGNAGSAAADAGRPADPIPGGGGHDSSIQDAWQLSSTWASRHQPAEGGAAVSTQTGKWVP
jgi:hypothetical protein